MLFDIPECNFHTLQEKLAKIERKAKKYNCEFSFVVSGEEIREKAIKNANGTISTYNVKYYIVDVSGTAKINNWQFLATITHYENGNVICGYNDSIAIPERYKKCNPYCEHCKSLRNRKDTYLIYNTETEEIKQVGKTCLKDYTDGLSAENVAYFETFFKEISESENDYDFISHGYDNYYTSEEMFKIACEVIRIFGYKKSENYAESTKAKVIEYYRAIHNNLPYEVQKTVIREMENVNFNIEREENKIEIENALNWIKEMESNSQYLDNLKVISSLEYFEKHHIGILCSLFPAYNKAMETENRKKAERESTKNSDFIGNINDKIQVKIKTCKCVFSYETQYGYSYIYQMISDDNNVLVWKTSKIIENEKDFTIKGTVKNHNDYNGIKQTELIRCKII